MPRSLKVFVSSTYLDMGAERDQLVRRVFPALEEFLSRRGRNLVTVDLGWGVSRARESRDDAERFRILLMCFEEIARCRPYFVGLMGDRHGWIPPRDVVRAAAREAGFHVNVDGKSVTELEFECGMLATPERPRGYIYLRDPLPLDTMDEESAAIFSDTHGSHQEVLASSAKLEALKIRFEALLPNRVRHYRAHWDAASRGVVGLDTFAALVFEDLKREFVLPSLL